MSLALKIRGIYTTALTCFFLEKGIAIASPSTEMAQRLTNVKGALFQESADAEISDLEGRQGILLQGEEDAYVRLTEFLRDNFLDAICRKRLGVAPCAVEVEFPYLTKTALDEQRNKIFPTVFNHHRLRIIASDFVDLMEKKELTHHPEKRKVVSENLERRLIWEGYTPGKEIAIEHVKLDGQVISLSEGEIIEADFKQRKLALKRSQFKGRSKYDGLDLSKQEGDYAITEVKEGHWFYRHAYMRKNGDLIGSYYNINTPVEFYPDSIRYIDLEIDVVAFPDGRVVVRDEEILEKQFENGYLGEKLRALAIKTAYDLVSCNDVSRVP